MVVSQILLLCNHTTMLLEFIPGDWKTILRSSQSSAYVTVHNTVH